MQAEEVAVSSALLQVAAIAGTTDIDLLVRRTLGVLPRLFGGEVATLLYLDHKRQQLRLLEPRGVEGPLTALTEVNVSPSKLELLDPLLRGAEPAAIEEAEIKRRLAGLAQSRGLRAALIIPLHLSNRQMRLGSSGAHPHIVSDRATWRWRGVSAS